jgi:hypothetical protein
MSTSLMTKHIPELSSRSRSGMIVVFYLLTFLAGGLFLFAGGRLGFLVDLTATVSYIAVAVLFYALSKGAS